MSRKQDGGLTKEKSIIKLKRNYSQEREIRETVTYTAGENEVPEPDTAKEYSVNKIRLVNVLKEFREERSIFHTQLEEVNYNTRKSEKHTIQGKLKSLYKSVNIDGEVTSSNSNSFSPKTNECTPIPNTVEVVKVDAEKLFVNQQSNQQIKIQSSQKLKKRTQDNVVYNKKRIAIYIRIIRREILAVRKGKLRKRQGNKSFARRIQQSRIHLEFNMGRDNEVIGKQVQLKNKRLLIN
jgi:hypothetical protein